jgi:hypothetical protein
VLTKQEILLVPIGGVFVSRPFGDDSGGFVQAAWQASLQMALCIITLSCWGGTRPKSWCASGSWRSFCPVQLDHAEAAVESEDGGLSRIEIEDREVKLTGLSFLSSSSILNP